MSTNSTALRNKFSRLHIIEGGARFDHTPAFAGSIAMQALSEGLGDVTRVTNPVPDQPGSFEEIAAIRGAPERATSTLIQRFPLDGLSALAYLAKKKCAFDLHLLLGECESLANINTYTKKLILEGTYPTNYSTDELGILSDEDEAIVNDNSEISIKQWYEIVPVGYGRQADSLITNEILDVVNCGGFSCGNCEDESDGCDHFYALSKAAGGSSGTPADIVFTPNKGRNWYAHDIDTLAAAEEPTAIGCLGPYLVVVSNATLSYHYVLKSELRANYDPSWTEVATGFLPGGGAQAIAGGSSKAYIVGDLGNIYLLEDVASGVTQLTSGVLDQLLAVDILGTSFVIVVGTSGTILYSTDGLTFSRLTTSPVGVGINFTCVAIKNIKEWYLGANNGKIYATKDGGDTWSEVSFPGSGSGTVEAIKLSTNSVLWMSHTTAGGAGRILRSTTSGNSWTVEPQGIATLPSADRFNALAVCRNDPNFVMAVGLDGAGSDGIITVGKPSSSIF